MKPQVIVHLGLHKTGTTSIQHWLLENTAVLAEHGIVFHQGRLNKSNHIEFGLTCVRHSLDMPIRQRHNLCADTLYEETKQALHDRLNSITTSRYVISNEALSFIRTLDEMEKLKNIFPKGVEVIPVLFLREKQQWLTSFKSQMKKVGRLESDDPTSCTYFAEESWLLDHSRVVDLAGLVFGTCKVVHYNGASVAQFLEALNVNLPVSEPRRNVTHQA